MEKLETILNNVSEITGIPINAICGKSRQKEVIKAKFLLSIIATKNKFSKYEICEVLNLDRVSIFNHLKKENYKYISDLIEIYEKNYIKTNEIDVQKDHYKLFIYCCNQIRLRRVNKSVIYDLLSDYFSENQVAFFKKNAMSVNAKLLFTKIMQL